ncbi:hypothetical protein CCACVL1_03639 [Corchorus capsularis]|uniref:Uncharacterized protein n=1 Tax=Corchorus capsularis TaxID=210143 RepID=A0A1R3JY81_COCAP|nr:hypothetical protein CCACVL1_03639 [Corchorus capsularis]
MTVAIKSVESQAAARANTNNKAIMSKGNSVSKRREFHKFTQAHPSPWPYKQSYNKTHILQH